MHIMKLPNNVIWEHPFNTCDPYCYLSSGVDGGFDNNEPEYDETYNIVILPNYATLPFPSVELPEKVKVLSPLPSLIWSRKLFLLIF